MEAESTKGTQLGVGAFVIPAYNAGSLLSAVLDEIFSVLREGGRSDPVVVVDDGSTDETGAMAESKGAIVISHEKNRGKGAALQSALRWADERKIEALVTLDADGQHPPREAVRLMNHLAPLDELVLGVRDLKKAGAPAANRGSNAFSNRVLSLFGGRSLRDTQCGLRRYPVKRTLALGAHDTGYAFEADVVLRAARRGLPIVHVDTDVLYPDEGERLTYFDAVRDPARMVLRVVHTTLVVQHANPARRWGRWVFVLALVFAFVFAAL